MATLSGNKIKNTYQSLVKFSDNGNITTSAKQLTDGFGNNSPMFVSTTQVGIGVTPESGLNLHVYGDAKIGSNLTVIGNLVVEGSTTTVGTDTLTVKDPLIVLANNNTSTDAVDIGFYGKYTPSGTTLYSGLFREALTGKYRLFKDLQVEPTTTVNTSGTGYEVATLIANLEGNFIGGTISSTGANFSGNIIIESGLGVPMLSIQTTTNNVQGVFYVSNSEVVIGSNTNNTLRLLQNGGTALTIDTSKDVTFVGDIILSGTVDGRDVSVDGAKLDGIEASADVTDATNVLAAGAVMTSGNQSISGVKTFSDQVTIPATPSASTDAASKGYVDTKVGENNELSEVLANGNTTGSTDIAVSANAAITFSDNSKAKFGIGSDLQIYHDTVDSFIKEQGIGALKITSNNTLFYNVGFVKLLANFDDIGVKLYYDNSLKLATTSYGINVTGAINADDYISIEGATNPYLRIQDTTNEEYLNLYSSDNESAIVYTQDTFKISSGIDFLNQTPRLTIDSSGNSTFAGALNVNGNATLANYSGTSENYTILAQNDYGQMRAGIRSGVPYIGSISSLPLDIYTGNSSKIRIDTLGNVGITASASLRFNGAGDNTHAVGYDSTIDGSFLRGQNGMRFLTGTGGGSERMRISSTGYVIHKGPIGAGTNLQESWYYGTDSNFRLDLKQIVSSGLVKHSFNIVNNGTGYDNNLVLTNGNVGIGTDSPQTLLNVNSLSGTTYPTLGTASGVIALSINELHGMYLGVDGASGNGWIQAMREDASATAYNLILQPSGGNVGIGTTSPSAKLEAVGTSGLPATSGTTFTGTMRLNVSGYGTVLDFGSVGPATGTQWLQATDKADLSITYPLLLNPNGGNVGIGTDDPDYKVDTLGTNQYALRLNTTDADGCFLTLQTNSVAKSYIGTSYHLLLGTQSADDTTIRAEGNLQFSAGGSTERMRVTSSGLIQASAGGGGFRVLSDSGNSSNLIDYYYNSSFNHGLEVEGDRGLRMYSSTGDSSAKLTFYTEGTERMRITSGGDLLVGATALSDVGSLTKSHLLEGNSATAGTGAVGVYNNSGTANCPSLVVLNRDTSTDSSNRFIQFYANVIGGTNTPMGGIVGNGASNVQFASLSDIREKENVKTINGSLDKISKLNPVEFDWKKSGEHINAGFIAQEVENIFPEYVVENISNEDEEERKGLTGGMTSGIVAHLVKSIQELKAEVELLKTQINN